MIKDIHLTLEVKTFFGNSTPATGISMESSTYKSGLLTNSRHRHHRKRGKEETCTQQFELATIQQQFHLLCASPLWVYSRR
jgi:hypothetical protein